MIVERDEFLTLTVPPAGLRQPMQRSWWPGSCAQGSSRSRSESSHRTRVSVPTKCSTCSTPVPSTKNSTRSAELCVCVGGGGGATKCSTIISSEQGSYRLWQFRNLGKLRCLFLGLEIVWDNENFGHCLGKWEVHDFGDGLTDNLQTGDSERKVEAEWWKIQGKYKIDFTWNHTQTCSRSLSAATCGTSYCPWNRHAVAIGLGGWSPRLGILKQKSCLNPGLPQQKYSRLMQHVCVLICMSVSLVCILFRGPWTVCEGWQHLVLSQPPSVRGSTRFGPWANSVHIVLSAPLWLDMSPRVW